MRYKNSVKSNLFKVLQTSMLEQIDVQRLNIFL